MTSRYIFSTFAPQFSIFQYQVFFGGSTIFKNFQEPGHAQSILFNTVISEQSAQGLCDADHATWNAPSLIRDHVMVLSIANNKADLATYAAAYEHPY